MKCWICERKMYELEFVKGDYACVCGSKYCKEGSHSVFRDIDDNIISKPLYNAKEKEDN